MSEVHRSYVALQYPLLFPRWGNVYHFDIPFAAGPRLFPVGNCMPATLCFRTHSSIHCITFETCSTRKDYILASSYTGSPWYMHERTQDTMTYAWHIDRPDLFITFICNFKWPEIIHEVLPGQRVAYMTFLPDLSDWNWRIWLTWYSRAKCSVTCWQVPTQSSDRREDTPMPIYCFDCRRKSRLWTST